MRAEDGGDAGRKEADADFSDDGDDEPLKGRQRGEPGKKATLEQAEWRRPLPPVTADSALLSVSSNPGQRCWAGLAPSKFTDVNLPLLKVHSGNHLPWNRIITVKLPMRTLSLMQAKVTETSGKLSHLAGSRFLHLVKAGCLISRVPHGLRFSSAPLSPPAFRAVITVPIWRPHGPRWKK